ncbi:hypothetical protein [Enterovibrio nigricans]|uniref:Uncharacterized protein n=1 Tax=Enterovibrio nigricans DSM 22720 TaxID=1121868 RepID=A0A1T4UZU1_9GAMM|nr:hypothetical protein [Enterovibrio nigricans]PKF50090.1 hypothetical protein AT251_14100 [Enterovibrio nigricans]SKA57891.1 hypothetical protein SAMN02745132_02839 [Enterovibrio nigricans DSM 22720]
MTVPSRKLSVPVHSSEQENAQLRKEIDALYAAAEAREQQLLAATHAMDDILLEMESQRNALKRNNKQLLELNAYIRSINDAMNSILVVVGIGGTLRRQTVYLLRIWGGLKKNCCIFISICCSLKRCSLIFRKT